jgi:hypothetical protein
LPEHDTEAEFVDVYAKATGAKQAVPAEWLDNPVLADAFRKTPTQKAADSVDSSTGARKAH